MRCNNLSFTPGRSTQAISFTQDGHLQFAKFVTHKLICIRVEQVSQMACDEAPAWAVVNKGAHNELQLDGKCLTRGSDSGDQVKLRACDGRSGQKWIFKEQNNGTGITVLWTSLCSGNRGNVLFFLYIIVRSFPLAVQRDGTCSCSHGCRCLLLLSASLSRPSFLRPPPGLWPCARQVALTGKLDPASLLQINKCR